MTREMWECNNFIFLICQKCFQTKQEFFYRNFSHSNTAKKCEENIKTKTKRREKKWICTKTTYHATTGLVFQYITTPEKPCATQISKERGLKIKRDYVYQSNIGLVTWKPFAIEGCSGYPRYEKVRALHTIKWVVCHLNFNFQIAVLYEPIERLLLCSIFPASARSYGLQWKTTQSFNFISKLIMFDTGKCLSSSMCNISLVVSTGWKSQSLFLTCFQINRLSIFN